MTTLLVILAGILCATVYRIRGSGDTPLNINPLPEVVFSLPVGLTVYLETSNPWWAVLAVTFSTYILLKGHGQYITYWFTKKRTNKIIKPEDLDVFIRPLFGDDPRMLKTYPVLGDSLVEAYGVNKLYARCMFGLWVKNALFLLPALITSPSATLLAMTTLMPLSYAVGWLIAPKYRAPKAFPSIANDAHKISEIIFGFMTGVIGFIFYLNYV